LLAAIKGDRNRAGLKARQPRGCAGFLQRALLASDVPGKLAGAREALDTATAAAEATGSRAELPFIELAREKLVPVG